MHIISLIFKREWKLFFRKKTQALNPWVFFLLVVTLFPLALSPDSVMLTHIAPGIIWVAVLLTTMLTLEKLFRQEVDDGVIEQWLLAPHSFQLLVTAKLMASWCINYLPLLLCAPIVAMWLQLSFHASVILLITYLIATPSLHFIGAIFSALTVSLRHSGVLLAILVLPFYVPILIFAASAVANAELGLPVAGVLAFLGAILALTLPLAPYATALALKIGIT